MVSQYALGDVLDVADFLLETWATILDVTKNSNGVHVVASLADELEVVETAAVGLLCCDHVAGDN